MEESKKEATTTEREKNNNNPAIGTTEQGRSGGPQERTSNLGLHVKIRKDE